jgi:hypothetical protein
MSLSDGRQSYDPNARKFVRTHVMHNNQRQKQVAAHAKPGLQVMEIQREDNDAETIVERERPVILSPERWGKCLRCSEAGLEFVCFEKGWRTTFP